MKYSTEVGAVNCVQHLHNYELSPARRLSAAVSNDYRQLRITNLPVNLRSEDPVLMQLLQRFVDCLSYKVVPPSSENPWSSVIVDYANYAATCISVDYFKVTNVLVHGRRAKAELVKPNYIDISVYKVGWLKCYRLKSYILNVLKNNIIIIIIKFYWV